MEDINEKSPDWYERATGLAGEGRLAEAVEILSLGILNRHRLAESFFQRAVCHYRLGNHRMARQDLNAASLLGCEDALMWSQYDIQRMDDSEWENPS